MWNRGSCARRCGFNMLSPQQPPANSQQPNVVNGLARNRIRCIFLIASVICLFSGCNKADVQTAGDRFQTEITILEPAYAMRKAHSDDPTKHAETAWYGDMQVL